MSLNGLDQLFKEFSCLIFMVLGQNRQDLSLGLEVDIVQKHHQVSGELTNGFIKRILTKSKQHPHGIKVILETGEIGRVKHIYLEG